MEVSAMSHHHLADYEAESPVPERSSPARVATVASNDDGFVHLIDRLDPTAGPRTMCQVRVVQECPASRIWTCPCRACVAIALRSGFTVAREQNAMVNLQRIPLPRDQA
jgi:hypothetical protein